VQLETQKFLRFIDSIETIQRYDTIPPNRPLTTYRLATIYVTDRHSLLQKIDTIY